MPQVDLAWYKFQTSTCFKSCRWTHTKQLQSKIFITFPDFPNLSGHLNMADRKGLKDELQDQSPDLNPIEKLKAILKKNSLYTPFL